MTTEEIKQYWPNASIAQVIAIRIFHGAGWNIGPQDDDGMIPCSRPDTMETVEHALIRTDGTLIPCP